VNELEKWWAFRKRKTLATGNDSKILNCDPKTQDKTPAENDIVPLTKKEIYITLHKDENVDCVFRKKGRGGEGQQPEE
jgi:hypothetical protein